MKQEFMEEFMELLNQRIGILENEKKELEKLKETEKDKLDIIERELFVNAGRKDEIMTITLYMQQQLLDEILKNHKNK